MARVKLIVHARRQLREVSEYFPAGEGGGHEKEHGGKKGLRSPGCANASSKVLPRAVQSRAPFQEVTSVRFFLPTAQHYARGLRHHDSLDYSGILPKNPYLESSRGQLRVRTFLRWVPEQQACRRSRFFPCDGPPPGIVDARVVLGLDLPEEPAADHGEHDGPGPEDHEVCGHAEMGHIDEGAPQGIHPV